MTPYDQAYQETDPLFNTVEQHFPGISTLLYLTGATGFARNKIMEWGGINPGTTMRDPFRKRGDSYWSSFGKMDYDSRADLVRSFNYSMGDWAAADSPIKNALSFLDSTFLENNEAAKEAFEYAIQSAGSGVSFASRNKKNPESLTLNEALNRVTSVNDVSEFFRSTVLPFNPVMKRGDTGILASEYSRANFGDLRNFGLNPEDADGISQDEFRKLLDKADNLVNSVSEINRDNKKSDGTLGGSVRVVEKNGQLELATTGKLSDSDLKRVTDQLKEVNNSLATVANKVSVSAISNVEKNANGSIADVSNDLTITTGTDPEEIKRRAQETSERFKNMQVAIAQWQKVLDTDVIETIKTLSGAIGSNVLSTFGNAGRQLALNAGMVQHLGALTGRGSGYPLGAIEGAGRILAGIGGDRSNAMMVGLSAAAWGNPTSDYRIDRAQFEQKILATYAGNIESETAKSVGALFSRVYASKKGDKGWENVDSAISSFESMMENDKDFRDAFMTNGVFDYRKFNAQDVRAFMESKGMDSNFTNTDWEISKEGTLALEFRNKSKYPVQIAGESHLREGRQDIFNTLDKDVQQWANDDKTQMQIMEAVSMEESAGAARIEEIARSKGVALKKGQATQLWDTIRGTLDFDRKKLMGQMGLTGAKYANMTTSEFAAFLGKPYAELYEEAEARSRVSALMTESGGLRGAVNTILSKDDVDNATMGAVIKMAFGADATNDALVKSFGIGGGDPNSIETHNNIVAFREGVEESEDFITKYNDKNRENGVTLSREEMQKTITRDYKKALKSGDEYQIYLAKRRAESLYGGKVDFDKEGNIVKFEADETVRELNKQYKDVDMQYLAEQSNSEAIDKRDFAMDEFGISLYKTDSDGKRVKAKSLTLENATSTKEKTAVAVVSALNSTSKEYREDLDAAKNKLADLRKKRESATSDSDRAKIDSEIKAAEKVRDNLSSRMGALKSYRDKIESNDLLVTKDNLAAIDKLTMGKASKNMEKLGIDPQQTIVSLINEIITGIGKVVKNTENSAVIRGR